MQIKLAQLYARQRADGAITLSGTMGYNGRLRILPNPDKVEGDTKSPDFIAYLEERSDNYARPYNGPQLLPQAPRPTPQVPRPSQRPALPQAQNFVEGEIMDGEFPDPFSDEPHR
jgi:hypothetical protein